MSDGQNESKGTRYPRSITIGYEWQRGLRTDE
jgi:hypothetical protein